MKSYSQVNSDISNPYLFGVLLVRCRKDTTLLFNEYYITIKQQAKYEKILKPALLLEFPYSVFIH